MPDGTEMTPDDGILELRREVSGRAVVVHAAGEVDLVSAPQLAAELTKAAEDVSTQPFVLDLTGITFIASSGLAVLVEHHQRGLRTNHDLRIVVGTSVVARAINRTGLDQFLPVYATISDALAAGTVP